MSHYTEDSWNRPLLVGKDGELVAVINQEPSDSPMEIHYTKDHAEASQCAKVTLTRVGSLVEMRLAVIVEGIPQNCDAVRSFPSMQEAEHQSDLFMTGNGWRRFSLAMPCVIEEV